jgi:hypothetical protein
MDKESRQFSSAIRKEESSKFCETSVSFCVPFSVALRTTVNYRNWTTRPKNG